MGLATEAWIGGLGDLRKDLATSLAESSSAAIARAQRELAIAIGVTGAVVLVTLMLAVALLRSVTQGVARLSERARRIQQGELAIEPIPPGGPRDIALLTSAFNDMAETLRGVDERASALAGGGDLASSTRALPGKIGEAMDRSVVRLSQATRTLRAREALSRSIVASAADAVWTVDSDGVIRSANGAASRTFGLAEDEMTGRPSTRRRTGGARARARRRRGARARSTARRWSFPTATGTW